MDIKQILEYQKVDAKLYELESELAQDENKAKCNELSQRAKNAQLKSTNLELQASGLIKELDELNKNMALSTKKGSELLSKNIESMTSEEVDSAIALKDKVYQNVNLLDKRFTKLAEQINMVLAQFNSAVKDFNSAKEQFTSCKAEYDKKVATLQPQINELKSKLDLMQKNVEQDLMQKYLARRADKIFPVFVKLDGSNCGRCRMELSASALSKLKENKILQCEHCHRIIYVD